MSEEIPSAGPGKIAMSEEILSALPGKKALHEEMLPAGPGKKAISEEIPSAVPRKKAISEEILSAGPGNFGIKCPVVDVFTHSSTGFPGAWTEDQIATLLVAWQELIDDMRNPTRRSDLAYKVLIRLKKKGFSDIDKETVRRQLTTLYTEYKTFIGIEQIGIPAVKAKCFSKLEKIIGPDIGPSLVKGQVNEATSHTDNASEDSDHSQRVTIQVCDSTTDEMLYHGNYALQNSEVGNKLGEDLGENPAEELAEEVGTGRRRRFQRRANIRRLVQQQQVILLEIQKAGQVKDEANTKITALLTEMVSLQRRAVDVQEKSLLTYKASEV